MTATRFFRGGCAAQTSVRASAAQRILKNRLMIRLLLAADAIPAPTAA
jgi:hypothetical protein